MSRKVVYSPCYGGYGLSAKAIELLAEKKALSVDCESDCDELERHDEDLVAVVEELGSDASDSYANLQITTVEDKYFITEYDGFERVVEPHHQVWK